MDGYQGQKEPFNHCHYWFLFFQDDIVCKNFFILDEFAYIDCYAQDVLVMLVDVFVLI